MSVEHSCFSPRMRSFDIPKCIRHPIGSPSLGLSSLPYFAFSPFLIRGTGHREVGLFVFRKSSVFIHSWIHSSSDVNVPRDSTAVGGVGLADAIVVGLTDLADAIVIGLTDLADAIIVG
jgi:hypothetical protein